MKNTALMLVLLFSDRHPQRSGRSTSRSLAWIEKSVPTPCACH